MNGYPELTWEQMRAGLKRLSVHANEWAGIPMPVKGMRMIIDKSYPYHKVLEEICDPEPALTTCSNADIDESTTLRNSWNSYRDGKEIEIWRDSKGFFFTHSPRQNHTRLLIDTLGAARSWDYEAELRAQETLKRHVSDWAFKAYMMTGTFLETSPKSNVIYMFRRLRPTVAFTTNPDKRGRDCGVRILCCLCMHPVGYFDGSWAGALVPTDDALSHLLLMRADEAMYWKRCNQHPPSAPEAGL